MNAIREEETDILEQAAEILKRSRELHSGGNPYSVTVERALEILFRHEVRMRRKRGELVLIHSREATA